MAIQCLASLSLKLDSKDSLFISLFSNPSQVNLLALKSVLLLLPSLNVSKTCSLLAALPPSIDSLDVTDVFIHRFSPSSNLLFSFLSPLLVNQNISIRKKAAVCLSGLSVSLDSTLYENLVDLVESGLKNELDQGVKKNLLHLVSLLTYLILI